MFETLSKQELNAMTSDSYKAAFEGPDGDSFRKRVSELENQPAQTGRKRGSVRGEEPSATPASSGFDPSFDDQPIAAPDFPAAAAPVAAQPAAQPAEPMPREKMSVWSYFATDESGRKLGGEQKFFYDPNLPAEDPNSLASQLTKSNIHVRRMANKRKVEAVIESVKSVDGYKPPTLLTTDQHPNAEQLNAMTTAAHDNAVRSALNLFRQSHPEFPLSNENAIAMMSWIGKSGRSPLEVQTWESAWQSLKPYLSPESPAAEVPAPAVAPVVVEQPKAAPAPAVRPAQRAGTSTGLSNFDQTSSEDPVFEEPIKVMGVKLLVDGKTQVMDYRSWERLSSDSQKKILRNSANASAINALYDAENERRAIARSGR